MNSDFLKAVNDKLVEAFELYDINWKSAGEVQILFDVKGKVAGKGGFKDGQMYLGFNPQGLEIDYNFMVNTVIPHEIAHLIAQLRPQLGALGHNKKWKMIDRSLGGTNHTTHSLKLSSARRTRKFIYDLPKVGKVEVGAIRHKKIQNGVGYSLMSPLYGKIRIVKESFTGESKFY